MCGVCWYLCVSGVLVFDWLLVEVVGLGEMLERDELQGLVSEWPGKVLGQDDYLLTTQPINFPHSGSYSYMYVSTNTVIGRA